MKKGQVSAFLFHNLWLELAVGVAVVVAFMALGYFAREFALDLQANFFAGEWGAF